MNKQEKIDEINKTKEHLANMEKMLAKCDEMWEPEKGEMFYYLNSYNIAIAETWDSSDSDAEHYNIYNYFKTREQAEQEAEKILVRRMLKDIARRLNKGRKFDWYDDTQTKFFLFYHWKFNTIKLNSHYSFKGENVYCLDKNFLDIAIQEIGEERLKAYLRGE